MRRTPALTCARIALPILALSIALPARSASAASTLALELVQVDATTATAVLRLTSDEDEIAAVGARLRYDPSVLLADSVGDIQPGADLPASWSLVFAQAGTPGEIDLVLTDVTASATRIAGPVTSIEIARLEFDVIGPCPYTATVGFNTAAPVTPAEQAAFPSNHYVEHVDVGSSSILHTPAGTEIGVVRFATITARLVAGAGSTLDVRLELNAPQENVAAFGARLTYDESLLSLAGPGAVEPGPFLPASWSPVYLDLGTPGRIDLVYTDTTPTAALIDGPLTDAAVLRIRFDVTGARPGVEAFGFHDVPASGGAESAAFPVNHYIEYVDETHSQVCLVPADTRVADDLFVEAEAKYTLRLPQRFAPGDGIEVPILLSSDASEISAFGVGLAFDTAQVVVPTTARITAGPDLPGTWSRSFARVSVPGEADFVFEASDPGLDAIPGPVTNLHVATVLFSRAGPRPEEGAFGFRVSPLPPPDEDVFPYGLFLRVVEGPGEWTGPGEGCVVADRAGFIRGDCNADEQLDLADPVWHLNWLFRGGAEPPCHEACNSNTDAGLDISDAVYSLSYLFLGGPAPSAPFPACDESPYCAIDICP